jgi:hypothetical protein
MNIINSINYDFASLLEQYNISPEYKTIHTRLKSLGLRMQGHLIPWYIKPYFITEKQQQRFSYLMEVMVTALEKLLTAFYKNAEIRNRLSLKGRINEYLETAHHYSGRNIVVRADAFYNPQNNSFYFLEFNCGDPSGLMLNDLFVDIYKQISLIKLLNNNYNISGSKLIDIIHDTLIIKYREYCKDCKKQEHDNPLIAIVCSRNSIIRFDINLFVKFLHEKGVRAHYADPRDFEYDGKILRLKGEEVHIVYRDTEKDFFRTESSGKWYSKIRNNLLHFTRTACLQNPYVNTLLKHGYFGHAEDILKAFHDGNICLINPFSAKVTALKSVISILQDKRFCSLFNEKELNVIRNHTPWTRLLNSGKTDFDNKEIELVSFIKSHRELFVLKPNNGFGGQGVFIGRETNQTNWEKRIDSIVRTGQEYTVQEYIDVPTEEIPEFKNGKFKGFSTKFFNVNLWAIDGKFAGGFIRASNKRIINVSKGAGFAPIYYVKNKTNNT